MWQLSSNTLIKKPQSGFSLIQLFEMHFSYTIFKQFCNNLATQNKNHNQNWPFLTKDMNYLSFHSLALSG